MIFDVSKVTALDEMLREKGAQGVLTMAENEPLTRETVEASPFFATLEEAFHESIDTRARFCVEGKAFFYSSPEGVVALITALYALSRSKRSAAALIVSSDADTLRLTIPAQENSLDRLPESLSHALRSLAERMEVLFGASRGGITLTVPLARAAVISSYIASKDTLCAYVERTVQDLCLLEKGNSGIIKRS